MDRDKLNEGPNMATLRNTIRQAFFALGLDIKRVQKPQPPPPIPDGAFYTPLFSPWNGFGEFAKYRSLAEPYTVVSPDRLYVLYALARNAAQLHGDFWECGVYKGGTARMFAEYLNLHARSDTKLHLFDTFGGMPECDKNLDLHRQGDFSDTNLEEVRRVVGNSDRVEFHAGWIPDTFRDLQKCVIALAHVDVDIYRSVRDCCEFIYPRLRPGGVIVFDDYGFPSCPGARKAVDEFFAEKLETPIALPTGQAVLMRSAINYPASLPDVL
jgi:O-methyltransferase